MHPRGAVFDAVLDRTGSEPPWGVPWLDATARDDVVVRLSRGAGLPAPLPDLLGLAVRLPGDGGPVDLLLTTTGRGRSPAWSPFRAGHRRRLLLDHGLPLRRRVVRFAAFPEGDHLPSEPAPLVDAVARDGLRFTFAAATGRGPWRRFARLTLTTPTDPRDCDVRFDAVRNPPPGLVPDGPMARFRAPSYATARAEGHA